MTGGPAMSLLDCYMTEIDAGSETIPYRTTSNAVCVVAEGTGRSRVGHRDLRMGIERHFQHAHGNWIAHEARSKTAKLFVVTDREVLRRLDLLTEEYGNERR